MHRIELRPHDDHVAFVVELLGHVLTEAELSERAPVQQGRLAILRSDRNAEVPFACFVERELSRKGGHLPLLHFQRPFFVDSPVAGKAPPQLRVGSPVCGQMDSQLLCRRIADGEKMNRRRALGEHVGRMRVEDRERAGAFEGVLLPRTLEVPGDQARQAEAVLEGIGLAETFARDDEFPFPRPAVRGDPVHRCPSRLVRHPPVAHRGEMHGVEASSRVIAEELEEADQSRLRVLRAHIQPDLVGIIEDHVDITLPFPQGLDDAFARPQRGPHRHVQIVFVPGHPEPSLANADLVPSGLERVDALRALPFRVFNDTINLRLGPSIGNGDRRPPVVPFDGLGLLRFSKRGEREQERSQD